MNHHYKSNPGGLSDIAVSKKYDQNAKCGAAPPISFYCIQMLPFEELSSNTAHG